MSADPNDAIQSLARITKAAAEMMAKMHYYANTIDPDEHLGHIQANLDHVKKLVNEARK